MLDGQTIAPTTGYIQLETASSVVAPISTSAVQPIEPGTEDGQFLYIENAGRWPITLKDVNNAFGNYGVILPSRNDYVLNPGYIVALLWNNTKLEWRMMSAAQVETTNVGVGLIAYVRNNGDDLNGSGAITSPFASYNQAAKTLLPFIQPGPLFRPTVDLGPGQWDLPLDPTNQFSFMYEAISVRGVGKAVSYLNDPGSPLNTTKLTFGAIATLDGVHQTITGCSFLNAGASLLISRIIASVVPTSQIRFVDCDVQNQAIVATGSGGGVVSDRIRFENCLMNGSTLALHAMNFTIDNCVDIGAITADSTGVDGAVATESGEILSSNPPSFAISQNVALKLLDSHTNAGSMDGVNCSLSIDQVSFPTTGITFTTGATEDQVTYLSNMNAAQSIFHTQKVTVTPYATKARDRFVFTNLAVAGACVVNLDGAEGREITIQDGKGDAVANNITINAPAGFLFQDGSAVQTINTAFGFKHYVMNNNVIYFQ